MEIHGALSKMAFEKACSLEAPTTEAEIDELIDFSLAELNRRVGRAGFSPRQRVFGRQLRLPSSLLEDDCIDPYTIVQDGSHEMRWSETTRMAAAHGCVVVAPIAERCLQQPTVDVENHSERWWPENPCSSTDGRILAQGWCGPGVCVLSEEPKPGRKRDSMGTYAELLPQV